MGRQPRAVQQEPASGSEIVGKYNGSGKNGISRFAGFQGKAAAADAVSKRLGPEAVAAGQSVASSGREVYVERGVVVRDRFRRPQLPADRRDLGVGRAGRAKGTLIGGNSRPRADRSSADLRPQPILRGQIAARPLAGRSVFREATMAAWLISIGIVACLLGQADPLNAATPPAASPRRPEPLSASPEQPSPRQEQAWAIDQALEELGSPLFSVRRRASRFLWQQGLAAEPALQRAAGSPDREVRLRCHAILDDFRYGILPDTPDEINALIRHFRDGGPEGRVASLQKLAQREAFGKLERLLALESDAGSWRDLLVLLLRDPRAVEHYLPVAKLERLVAATGAAQDAAWRQAVLAQLLFSEGLLRRLSERGDLEVLVKVVDAEPSDAARREMLSKLFQNPAAIASLLADGQLEFVLRLIGKEPRQQVRGQWIGQMLGMSEAMRELAESEDLPRFLAFARESVEPDQRAAILQRVLQHPLVVQAILNKRGVEGLVAAASAETDPAGRGRLLAALAASQPVRQALTQQSQRDLLLKLAREQQHPEARNEYMKTVMQAAWSVLFGNAASRQELWKMIRAEPAATPQFPRDWRGEAVYRVLTMSPAEESLRDDEQMQWVLRFLHDQVTEEQRVRILEQLISNYRTQRVLGGAQYFEPLVALLRKLPATNRGDLLGRLVCLRNATPPAGSADTEQIVQLARKEQDAGARRAYLQRVFHDHATMASLLAAGLYDRLWEFVAAEKDPLEHAILRGDFYSTHAVVQRLQEKQLLTALLDFADQQTVPEARHQFLLRLFRNSAALSLMIKAGHFDALSSLARGDEDADQRAALLTVFYVSPGVIDHLAATQRAGDLLEFADGQLSDRAVGSFLQQICQQQEAVGALAEQGHLPKLLALVRGQKEDYYRSYLLRMVLAAPPVIQHFAANKRLPELFQAIETVPAAARYQVWEGLLQRNENLAAVIEGEAVDELLTHLSQEKQAEHRGRLLGRLLAQQAVIDYLTAKNRLPAILAKARDERDPVSRRVLLTAICSSDSAVEAVIEANLFEPLYELATDEPDAGQRSMLLAQLLANTRAVEYLVKADRVQLLLDVASQQDEVAVRRHVLTRILNSPAAIEALCEHAQFERVVKLCRLDPDAAARRRLLATLLGSPTAIQQLARADGLEATVMEVLGESDENARWSLLRSWVARPNTLAALLEAGLFDELFQAAQAQADPSKRPQLLLPLLTSAQGLQYLVAQQRVSLLTELLSGASQIAEQEYGLQRLFQNPAAIEAITVGGQLDPLLELARREPQDSRRGWLAHAILSQAWMRQHLVAQGREDFLHEAIEWLPDSGGQRQRMEQLVFVDLAAHHVVRGDVLAAEQMLAEAATDDLGRLRLAAWWHRTGQAGEHVARLQLRLQQQPPDTDAARLLSYLHRAGGDLESAREAAEMTGDPGLLKAVLVELGRWSEAAELQKSGPRPLPIPWFDWVGDTPARQRVERLSLLAAYQRLAGDQQGLDSTLAEIVQAAAEPAADTHLRWWCVEALLLNGSVTQGLELLAASDAPRAAEFYLYRNQYREALNLLGCKPGVTLDQAWIKALPATGSGDQPIIARVEAALLVFRALRLVGHDEQAQQLLEVLSQYADGQRNHNNLDWLRRQCWEQISQALFAAGDHAGAWKAGEKTLIEAGSGPLLLSRFYGQRQREAHGWWSFFRRRHAAEPAAETFARVHRVLYPPADEDPADFDALARQVAERDPADPLESWQAALASTCLRRNRLALAEELLRPMREAKADGAARSAATDADAAGPLWVEVLWRSERWQEAAQACHRLWQDDRQQLAWLYLSGHALCQAGEVEQSRQRLELVDRLAFDGRARLELSRVLQHFGLKAQADEQLRLVLRTAPFEHAEWNEAARLCGEAAVDGDPAAAVQWFELSLLDDLRPYFYLLENANYLRTPALVHRLRAAAAIDAGDIPAAMQHARLALRAAPAETAISEVLVQRFEQAGEHAAAEELFALQFQEYLEWTEAWPESAHLHNNLAWLAARCGRRLDEALRHAELAVGKRPGHGSYLDTLAEVHFQRGDRAMAIECSSRAAALDPDSVTLKQQLERFRSDPLPQNAHPSDASIPR